ncbi:hypothetical protein NPIL_681911 [Nephila pilipes]|uniref:Uncharacterized protein n=1 Tax=Nephila pilipes TaxID=299642 RepID=A0A8X6P2K6_NEPPI|nr:hypothetical protein NPIL_681911 [Nephila pilipes]
MLLVYLIRKGVKEFDLISVSRRPCQPIRDGRTLNIILGTNSVSGDCEKRTRAKIEFLLIKREDHEGPPRPKKKRKERGKKETDSKRWSNPFHQRMVIHSNFASRTLR